MPKSPTRLELTWIGKHKRPKLEPRILLERPEHGHGATAGPANSPKGSTAATAQPNMLIHGDNLLALKALEADYTGKIKCICIDPPYNTGSAFEHYDDGLEHSVWLSLMRDRLEIMRKLLSDDGSIWVIIDSSESHYLKVVLDELFGRKSFVSEVIWKSSDNSNNDAKQFSLDHNSILVYSKSASWLTNKVRGSDDKYSHYKNPDGDPRGPWFDGNPLGSPNRRENLIYDLVSPQGHVVSPPSKGWRWSRETMAAKMKTGEIRFSEDGKRIKRRTYLWEQRGLPPSSLWTNYDETGHNRQAKSEQKKMKSFFKDKKLFDTPKPERLIHRILTIATNPGDLVLDSFAGSGTTGAVAHKMGRRWIMCELGDHAFTHIVPRMRKVIEGEDLGGVTETTNWKGGGAFRTYQLAPTLMTKDDHGQFVINPDYNAEMLAEAVCRHEGYTFDPSQDVYWIHGRSTEQAFIYVTTQTFTAEQLRALDDTVGEDRGLLVVCSAWKGSGTAYNNLTLKKIPRAVLDRCDWGRDDYSLNVESVQGEAEEEEDFEQEIKQPKTAQARMF